MVLSSGLLRKSGFAPSAKSAESLRFRALTLGQSCPQRCPGSPNTSSGSKGPLGAPLSIHEAADLIGCSTWAVRQTLIPLGLPHFRMGRSGKLIFYTNQIVRWIEHQQEGTTS